MIKKKLIYNYSEVQKIISLAKTVKLIGYFEVYFFTILNEVITELINTEIKIDLQRIYRSNVHF